MYVARSPDLLGQYEEDAPLSTTSDHWYSSIVSAVGDVGRETIERIRGNLVEQYAPEVWSRMSEQERQVAAQAALDDYRERYGWIPWAVGGTLAVVVLAKVLR